MTKIGARAGWARWLAVVALLGLLLVFGCGSDDDEGAAGTPSPTMPPATPTAQAPTPTPVTQAAVRGVLVVDGAVRAGEDDALRGAPEFAFFDPRFDRSLSFAEWSVRCGDSGIEDLRGTTDDSGRFEIAGLPPGECTLYVSKTVSGNLMSFAVPFVVGDDGAAEVIGEVSWGRVRITSLYTVGGEAFRRVQLEGGPFVVIRDGRIVELADYARHLIDADGDGRFDAVGCDDSYWQCNDFAGCGDGRRCMCTASCPDCEDCGPPVCAAGLAFNPYVCGEDGTCANPGDRCECVASGPGLRDCPRRVCVPACESVTLEAIIVQAPGSLIVGQERHLGAAVVLSDGSAMDVGVLAEWRSSDASILEIGAWGLARARSAGDAGATARLADLESFPEAIAVLPRPPLVNIHLQNFGCYHRYIDEFSGSPALLPEAQFDDRGFAPPLCLDAIEVGQSIQFQALGEFAGGHYEDITGEVAWSATPAGVGTIADGLFVGVAAGSADVAATLGNVTSSSRQVRVVTERTVVEISIYPESQWFVGILPVGDILPCFGFVCPGELSLLIGDDVQFRATAVFDIGGWEDVTDRVDWMSASSVVAEIAAGGRLTAGGVGRTSVRAALGEVESHPYSINVVAEATLLSLDVYQGGDNAQDRVIEAGGEAQFVAYGYYDVGFGRDATASATWRTSDPGVARFDTPGILTGLSAGVVSVWAELDGISSAVQTIEVFTPTDIAFCDVENVNRGIWTDGFNRVYLESDCASYARSEIVQIRFTVTERERPFGIFDPCLDLYAFRVENGRETFVRTIREEGCGEPFLAAGAPEFDDARLRYQLQAFWDLKDDAGSAVPPGTYRIKGRFYLYYDPVVTIDVTVN